MHSCLWAWEKSWTAIWVSPHKEDIIGLKNFPKKKKRAMKIIFSFGMKCNVSQGLCSVATGVWSSLGELEMVLQYI